MGLLWWKRDQLAAIPKRSWAPALLIVVLAMLVQALFLPDGFDAWLFLLPVLFWPLSVLSVFAAGRLLSGKGEYTRTFRALAFAQSVHFIELLELIPPIAPVVRVVTTVMLALAVWIGAAAAHETKGWRTFLLPVAFFGVWIAVTFVLGSLLGGLGVTLSTVLDMLGFTP
jgi:hypothetical protein